jgi:hypothetical protein
VEEEKIVAASLPATLEMFHSPSPSPLVKGEATRTAQLTIREGYHMRAEGKHLEQRRVRSDMKETI